MKNKGEGIYEVSYGGQSTISIVDAMANIRKIGLVLVIGLVLLAIFLIQNTIKLTISARSTEIEIMPIRRNKSWKVPPVPERLLLWQISLPARIVQHLCSLTTRP